MNMQFAHLEDAGLVLSYLAVNKLITYKTQHIFDLIAEHSGFKKYTLHKLNEII